MVRLEINVTYLCYGRLCVTYHPQFIRRNYVLNRLSIKFPWEELKLATSLDLEIYIEKKVVLARSELL